MNCNMEDHSTASDFVIRCLPEDVTFHVQITKLVEGSEVFAGMFACCGIENEENMSGSMDVYESACEMTLLVRLLHDPPLASPEARIPEGSLEQNPRAPSAVIPYLLLPRLLALAEKYALKPPIMQVLHAHLIAQASIAPLLVYGLATRHSLPEIADDASRFLSCTPLERYSQDDVTVIPSAEAYHKLLQLQNYRKRRIKELLMSEDLFPHGYGACSAHKDYAEAVWDKRRRGILPEIHSGSNVAGIMSRGLGAKIRTCGVCKKAWVAATEMLDYKCRRVARRISQLDKEGC